MSWIMSHWADIMATLAAGILLAEKVTLLTPTKVDDDAVAKIKSMIDGIVKK